MCAYEDGRTVIVTPRLRGWKLPLLHVEMVQLDEGRDGLLTLLGCCMHVVCVEVGDKHNNECDARVCFTLFHQPNRARTERCRGRPEQLLEGGQDAVAVGGVALGAQHLQIKVWSMHKSAANCCSSYRAKQKEKRRTHRDAEDRGVVRRRERGALPAGKGLLRRHDPPDAPQRLCAYVRWFE